VRPNVHFVEVHVKVSALIITFNQERFIAQAIEGFLLQKTDFPCELVIADDGSTDGTRDAIRPYWQRYPDRIRVLLNRRNIGCGRTKVHAYRACRGQYVALLDGDDYWTSTDKLQRQADWLDRRPDCALCFHSVNMVWEDASREPVLFRPPHGKAMYTLGDLLQGNFIASCAAMYRKGVFDEFPVWSFVMPISDWTQHVLHAQHGAIGYIDEPMAVYRQHGGGIHSMKPLTHQTRVAVEMLRRFRCALPRGHGRRINSSLCRSYCRLARQYCDEGKPADAKRCLRECFREVYPSLRISWRSLLSVTIRAWHPAFHERGKRLLQATSRLSRSPQKTGSDSEKRCGGIC
jgi:glycosyltransferase involved in cell wall biosynthesis